MFTNSRSSNRFMQNMQDGRYDRHCMALATLETIVFAALAVAFSCGMIGCSTASIAPCTGASCQNFTADGASGLDGAVSGDASGGGETGKNAEAGGTSDVLQFPEFKNSVPQVCDFQNNIPTGLECLKCKYDVNTQNWQGCGYKDLNSPAGNKCTKNPWSLNAPGKWKLVVNMIGDQCCGYTQACGYGNKPSCDSENVHPPSSPRFVIACRVETEKLKSGFNGCPDGFLFMGLAYTDSSGNCLLEDGTTFTNYRNYKDNPYATHIKKGKLWWKDGILYAGFCQFSDFADASREYPCNDPDGNETEDKYRIIRKISN